MLKLKGNTFTNTALNELNKIGIHLVNKILELTQNNIDNEEVKKVLKDIIRPEDLLKSINKKLKKSYEHAKENKKLKSIDKKYKLKINTKEMVKYIESKNITNNTKQNLATIGMIVQRTIIEIVNENSESYPKRITDKHIIKSELDTIINQSALEGLNDIELKQSEQKPKPIVESLPETVVEDLPETVDDTEDLFGSDDEVIIPVVEKAKTPLKKVIPQKQENKKDQKKRILNKVIGNSQSDSLDGLMVTQEDTDTDSDNEQKGTFEEGKEGMFKLMCLKIKQVETYKQDRELFIEQYTDQNEMFSPERIHDTHKNELKQLYGNIRIMLKQHKGDKHLKGMLNRIRNTLKHC